MNALCLTCYDNSNVYTGNDIEHFWRLDFSKVCQYVSAIKKLYNFIIKVSFDHKEKVFKLKVEEHVAAKEKEDPEFKKKSLWSYKGSDLKTIKQTYDFIFNILYRLALYDMNRYRCVIK